MTGKEYKSQRAFTAWVVAAYTFAMLSIGSTTLVFKVLGGNPDPLMFMTAVLASLIGIIFGLLISGIVWSRVFGHEV